MIIYRAIFTSIVTFFCQDLIFAQSGTIKVAKENSTEIFGLQSNRSGFPLSYIVLIDEKKALFINSFDDETTILRKYQEDEQIDGRIFHGMYKSERNQIYIFLNRGIQFKGSRVDDLLYLVDHTSEQVTFFKIHL